MSSDLQGSTLSINGRAYRPINASYNAVLWAAQNPILQRGEIGVEQDTLLFKVGNGVSRWNDLGYATGSPGPQGPQGPQGERGIQGDSGVSFSTTATIYTEENPLPAFADTPANTGYYYQHSNGVYDIYVHLENESDWFVIENWGGIAGPQGQQGIQGIQGPQGEQGPQGIQGIQGMQGPAGTNALNFITQPGVYSASNPLPSFASVTEGDAYLYQEADDTYTLYAKAFGASDWTVIHEYGGSEGPQGPQGIQGDTGPYFTPSVDLNGDISWTNNGGLVNPTTRNIKGPQGDKGETGDKGDKGDTGPYFTPAVDASGNISWTNNGNLPNPTTMNIKGPQGIQGIQGVQGIQGPQGERGPIGPEGLVIKNIVMTDTTGIITVTVSSVIESAPTIKMLIGGNTIAGSWTGSGLTWTFTPSTPDVVFLNSWIITLPAA